MLKIRTIRTLAQAQSFLEEVTRHRLDLSTNPPKTRPTLAEHKQDPKKRIVWILRTKIKRILEAAREQGVDLAADGQMTGHRV